MDELEPKTETETPDLVDEILGALDTCGVDTSGIDPELLEEAAEDWATMIRAELAELQVAQEAEGAGNIADIAKGARVAFLLRGQVAEGVVIDVSPNGTHVEVSMSDEAEAEAEAEDEAEDEAEAEAVDEVIEIIPITDIESILG